MMKKLVGLIGACILVVACGGVKLATPTQADVDRVKSDYPDYSLEKLKEGQALYMANCGSCHGLKDPKGYTADQWAKIVPKMVGMVNKNEVKLDENAQTLILNYVTTMGTAGSGN